MLRMTFRVRRGPGRSPSRCALILCGSLLAAGGPVQGQGAPGGSGREIFSLTAAGSPAGGLPATVRLLSGSVTVATKDGARMLKAATPTEFLITLPEMLPQDFTLEFDIVPKQCCNPEDLAVEGTATLSRGSSSAHILWHRNSQSVMGGGPAYQSTTPADLQESTPGQLTLIVITVEGETVKLYTNGKRLYTLTERRFARGRVLRVFLGGQDDGDQAVFLARLRVLAGILTPAPIAIAASGQSASTGTLAQPGSTIRSAGSGPPPATVAGAPTAAATALPAGSTGALATGPVTTATTTSLTSETRIALFAPPAQRAIRLSGFAADGVTPLPARKIAVTGFSGSGAPPANLSRTARLSGFAGAGNWVVPMPRTIRVSGFAGAGMARELTTSIRVATGILPMPAPRSILLSGFAGAGNSVPLPSRTVRLAGFSGTGERAVPDSRKLTLPGFTGLIGSAGIGPSPRTVRLPGWLGAGPTLSP